MKILLITLFGFAAIGCASTGVGLSEKTEFWYEERSDKSSADLFYCKANVTEKEATPICYKAQKVQYKPAR